MIQITNTFDMDEKTFEINFYTAIFGTDFANKVTIDRSTDGYTDGILFEHKQNLMTYGRARALSQALMNGAINSRDFSRADTIVPRTKT